MEHPPKQGLKHDQRSPLPKTIAVLMEHPPKQGLKLYNTGIYFQHNPCFNGTSTKTRIETRVMKLLSRIPCMF